MGMNPHANGGQLLKPLVLPDFRNYAVKVEKPWAEDVSATVNVVDLMTLHSSSEHPHGVADEIYDALFPPQRPTIFAFHGYPWLIHRLTYRRNNHDNLHVRGYKEEGTTTTPFDMTVLNNMDRFQLAFDAIRRIPRFEPMVEKARNWLFDNLQRHKEYVMANGIDLPEIENWKWSA